MNTHTYIIITIFICIFIYLKYCLILFKKKKTGWLLRSNSMFHIYIEKSLRSFLFIYLTLPVSTWVRTIPHICLKIKCIKFLLIFTNVSEIFECPHRFFSFYNSHTFIQLNFVRYDIKKAKYLKIAQTCFMFRKNKCNFCCSFRIRCLNSISIFMPYIYNQTLEN